MNDRSLSKLPRPHGPAILVLLHRGSPDRDLSFISSHHDDGLSPTMRAFSLFSSIGNAWSGGPFIKSAHDLHELASQQDERAPQYEGDAIE